MSEDTIWVKPTSTDSRVVLSERDTAHPDGEAYVAAYPDSAAVEVGRTPAVQRLLADGKLRRVSVPKGATAAASEPDAPQSPAGATSNVGGQTNGGSQQLPESPNPEEPAEELVTAFGDETARKLAAGGFTTVDAVRDASDEDLDAVPGIGVATVEAIRAALAKPEGLTP